MQKKHFSLWKNLFIPTVPGLRVSVFQNVTGSDFKAGLNVALLAIPQGMAYALVAGLPIHYGLLGSAIAALMGGLFGGEDLSHWGRLMPPQFFCLVPLRELGLLGKTGWPRPQPSCSCPPFF